MDTRTVQLDYPLDVLSHISEEGVRQMAREAFYLRLYEQQLISSGQAAVFLGIARSDFLDLAGRYGVSIYDPDTDLAEDLRNVQSAES